MLMRIVVLALGLSLALGAQQPGLLFLTHSAGFVHDVVKRPAAGGLSLAEREMERIASGFKVVTTQDCSELTPERIALQRVIAFYTTGELPLTAESKAAFLRFIEKGGGFVGIHCATDTYYEWPEFGALIGGRFDGHPWHESVGVVVEDAAHPATRHLAPGFRIKDEIYQHREFSRSALQVLMTLDRASVDVSKGKRADGDYALSWCRRQGLGRVFYTALGHREEVWADAGFRRHLLNGIRWAAGIESSEPRPAAALDFLAEDARHPLLDASEKPCPLVRKEGCVTLAARDVHAGVASSSGSLRCAFRAESSAAVMILKLNGTRELVLAADAEHARGRFAGIDAPVQVTAGDWQCVDVSWRRGPLPGRESWSVRWNDMPTHCNVELPVAESAEGQPLISLQQQAGSTSLRELWCTSTR